MYPLIHTYTTHVHKTRFLSSLSKLFSKNPIDTTITTFTVCYTVSSINEMLRGEKMDGLLDALRAAGLSNVESSNVSTYVLFMRSMMKEKVGGVVLACLDAVYIVMVIIICNQLKGLMYR